MSDHTPAWGGSIIYRDPTRAPVHIVHESEDGVEKKTVVKPQESGRQARCGKVAGSKLGLGSDSLFSPPPLPPPPQHPLPLSPHLTPNPFPPVVNVK